MADNNTTIDTNNLSKFAEELVKILQKYRSNDVLSKKTTHHQKNLEKLLGTTNKILDDKATSDDFESFDELVELSEASYAVMKQSHENDKRFQREYAKTFGKNQGFSEKIFSRISVQLGDLTKTVDVISRDARQDATDTALDFLVGPVGKIVKDSVDVGKVKEIFGKGSNVKDVTNRPVPDLSGQAHDGMTNVPREGTYMLDGGERVLSPTQNRDLTSFLTNLSSANDDAPKEGYAKVHNVGHDANYFDSLIDSQEERFREQKSYDKKNSEEISNSVSELGDIFTTASMDFFTKWVTERRIWFNRWKRHPITTTLGTLAEKMGSLLSIFVKPVTWLFGKLGNYLFGTEAKKDTDRIVQSNQDISDLLEKGQKEDRRGKLERMWEGIKAGSATGLSKMLLGSNYINSKKEKEQEALKKRFNDRSGMTQISLLEQIRDGVNILAGIEMERQDEEDDANNKSRVGGLAGMLKKFGGLAAGIGGKMLRSLGSSLLKTAKTLGPKIFSGVAMKTLGAIGLAFTGGDLIGKHLVNPLINKLDEIFKTDIGGAIGKAVAWLVVQTSKLPFIGQFIDSSDAKAALAMDASGPSAEMKQAAAIEQQRQQFVQSVTNNNVKDITTHPDYAIKQGPTKDQSGDNISYEKMEKAFEKPLNKLSAQLEKNNNNTVTQKPAVEDLGTFRLIHGY